MWKLAKKGINSVFRSCAKLTHLKAIATFTGTERAGLLNPRMGNPGYKLVCVRAEPNRPTPARLSDTGRHGQPDTDGTEKQDENSLDAAKKVASENPGSKVEKASDTCGAKGKHAHQYN
eukprot:1160706-Pelagomonas_calceolata.AAC.1